MLWEREQALQYLDGFKVGMRELGYAEGRDYAIEHRSAQSDLTRLPELVAELIALKVDLIFPSGTASAVSAHTATHDIPILIATVSDPVSSGLAASLRRPGGNVTGLTNLNSELYTKRLDLLRQMLPDLRRVGILYNPGNNTGDAPVLIQFESNCAKLGFKSVRAPLRKAEDVADVFKKLQREMAQAILVTTATTNGAWRKSIIEHAAKYRLPAVFGAGIFAESEGLLTYGPDFPDLYRRAATYADKIFKGAKPGDLPIEQPNNFETVINLKTAKALGIKIPNSILVQAAKVIE